MYKIFLIKMFGLLAELFTFKYSNGPMIKSYLFYQVFSSFFFLHYLVQKLSCLPPDTNLVFQSVVDKCLEVLSSSSQPQKDLKGLVKIARNSNADADLSYTMSKESVTKETKNVVMKGRIEEVDKDDDDSDEDEEEDYSYLHILKKDSLSYQESMEQVKKEIEEQAKAGNFSSDFISLNSNSNPSAVGSGLGSVKSKHLGKDRKRKKHKYDHRSNKSKNQGEQHEFVTRKSCVEGSSNTNTSTNTCSRISLCGSSDFNKSKSELSSSSSNSNYCDIIKIESSTVISSSTSFSPSDVKDHVNSSESKSGNDVTEINSNCKSNNKLESEHATKNSNNGSFTAPNITISHSDTKNTTTNNDDVDALPLFTISRKGDSLSSSLSNIKNKNYPQSQQQSKFSGIDGGTCGSGSIKSVKNDKDDSIKDDSILGVDVLLPTIDKKKKEETQHILDMFSASAKGSNNKRKLEQRVGDDTFISFAYTEANIQTMVSNPSKKKKRKRKK